MGRSGGTVWAERRVRGVLVHVVAGDGGRVQGDEGGAEPGGASGASGGWRSAGAAGIPWGGAGGVAGDRATPGLSALGQDEGGEGVRSDPARARIRSE